MDRTTFQRLINRSKQRLTDAMLAASQEPGGNVCLTADFCALVWTAAACREGLKKLDGLSEEEIQQLETVFRSAGTSVGKAGAEFTEAFTKTVSKIPDTPPTPSNGSGSFGGRLGGYHE